MRKFILICERRYPGNLTKTFFTLQIAFLHPTDSVVHRASKMLEGAFLNYLHTFGQKDTQACDTRYYRYMHHS